MKKYPLYIIALLSCILFLSCDKTKHEDTWWFDNETENLLQTVCLSIMSQHVGL